MVRRRRTGIARTMARTALVAGTAQTVAGGIARRQHAAAAQQQAASSARRPKATPGMLTDEVVDQLKKLGELRDAGVLTEKEFSAKKAKLLP